MLTRKLYLLIDIILYCHDSDKNSIDSFSCSIIHRVVSTKGTCYNKGNNLKYDEGIVTVTVHRYWYKWNLFDVFDIRVYSIVRYCLVQKLFGCTVAIFVTLYYQVWMLSTRFRV